MNKLSMFKTSNNKIKQLYVIIQNNKVNIITEAISIQIQFTDMLIIKHFGELYLKF